MTDTNETKKIKHKIYSAWNSLDHAICWVKAECSFFLSIHTENSSVVLFRRNYTCAYNMLLDLCYRRSEKWWTKGKCSGFENLGTTDLILPTGHAIQKKIYTKGFWVLANWTLKYFSEWNGHPIITTARLIFANIPTRDVTSKLKVRELLEYMQI